MMKQYQVLLTVRMILAGVMTHIAVLGIGGCQTSNTIASELTFGGQSTFILPVEGKEGAFIAMFDVWTPRNPIDGHYIWLPVQFEDGKITVNWKDRWDLSIFDR